MFFVCLLLCVFVFFFFQYLKQSLVDEISGGMGSMIWYSSTLYVRL